MKIGVVSDTHSRHATVSLVLAELQARGVTTVIHCGDIEDQETVLLFRGLTTHFVFGNCDGDKTALRTAMAEVGATLHENFGHVEIAGRKLAFLHGDDKRMFHDVEYSGAYDFLFYGHTHQPEEHLTGPTRVINPGALHRARPKQFIVLDLPDGAIEPVEVE
ncbi:MAG TPA: YfcE family phosphodiesterase [Planctomycetales bacterium]|jgi:putative phosphoesterase|nr:YfcE family phosphodiesterase [Planctomycetales bacterium]